MKNPLRLVSPLSCEGSNSDSHSFVSKSTVVKLFGFQFHVACIPVQYIIVGFCYVVFIFCLIFASLHAYLYDIGNQSHVCFRVGDAFVVGMSLSIFGLQRYTMLATSIHTVFCSSHLSRL